MCSVSYFLLETGMGQAGPPDLITVIGIQPRIRLLDHAGLSPTQRHSHRKVLAFLGQEGLP